MWLECCRCRVLCPTLCPNRSVSRRVVFCCNWHYCSQWNWWNRSPTCLPSDCLWVDYRFGNSIRRHSSGAPRCEDSTPKRCPSLGVDSCGKRWFDAKSGRVRSHGLSSSYTNLICSHSISSWSASATLRTYRCCWSNAGYRTDHRYRLWSRIRSTHDDWAEPAMMCCSRRTSSYCGCRHRSLPSESIVRETDSNNCSHWPDFHCGRSVRQTDHCAAPSYRPTVSLNEVYWEFASRESSSSVRWTDSDYLDVPHKLLFEVHHPVFGWFSARDLCFSNRVDLSEHRHRSDKDHNRRVRVR